MAVFDKIIYFISSSFPPLGRGGAIIRAYFAKYLSDDGWDVKVITAGKRKGFFLKWEYDYNLYNKLKNNVDIKIVQPFQWGIIGETLETLKLIPSLMINWASKVNRNLAYFIDKDKKGIVLATYPDIANFYVGLEIKKKYKLPLVLDFRDDYFGQDVRRFIENADIIFTTTETVKNKIHRNFNFNPGKIFVIYNGYTEAMVVSEKVRKNEKLDVVYAGTIAKAQKPEILNMAYRVLLKKRPELKDKIKINIYGQKGYYYKYFYKKTLCDGISFNGFVPHNVLMQKMLDDVDIGFFSLASPDYSYATPTKLFEYINLEIPILAALPEGETKSIIEKYGIGKVSDCSDIEGLANNLYDYYAHPQERERLKGNIRKIKDQFGIYSQAKKMSEVLRMMNS